jgi:NSS family neurotransmitter:Na+ symporter
MLPGAEKGIEFLFKPDFRAINSDVFLAALGQSFYSMSIAMGCICTYASYFSRQTNLTKSAIQIGVIDSMVAILAGLMIFPAAFSVGVSPDSGPSLIFVTLPNVFQQAFAQLPAVGYIISVLFFLLLSLAALTSLMSLHEVCTAFFYEELNISRRKGASMVTLLCAVLGVFCALSYGDARQWLVVGGKSVFSWFDFLTGQMFLPIGGFVTCLFLGWYVPKTITKDEFTNGGTLRGRFFGIYFFAIRYICPICILLIFLHEFNVI